MARFLTPEWFDKVAALTSSAHDLEVPKAMKDVVVNLTIAAPEGQVEMRMERGIMRPGHAQAADVLMQMPAGDAYRILVAGDWSVGMKGYIARRITLSGSMRKLIPLQIFRPTPTQDALRREIERHTEPA
jgi:hypothetical protein